MEGNVQAKDADKEKRNEEIDAEKSSSVSDTDFGMKRSKSTASLEDDGEPPKKVLKTDPEYPIVEPRSYAVANTKLKPTDREYNMNSKKKSKALIFYHTTFDESLSLHDIKVAENDKQKLEITLQNLNFEVEICKDYKCKEIKDKLIKVAKKEDHSERGCIVVCLETHGSEGGIVYARDGPYKVDTLWYAFTGDKCSTLVGKPKLFFIEACRGGWEDIAVTSTVQVDSGQMSYLIPTHQDFLIFFSTVERFKAVDASTQSFFMDALCQELRAMMEEEEEKDIFHWMTRVCHNVASRDAGPDIRQVPCLNSTLTRSLYLPKGVRALTGRARSYE